MSVNYLTPTIGSHGYFRIKEPYQTAVGALYSCKSLRKLSDYLNNGEDPYELIYQDRSISQTEYESDLGKDMLIVGLQSDTGHWHYFPASYLISYPDPAGIPYQKRGLFIALPPMPIDQDLTFMYSILSEQVRDLLGVEPTVVMTENSAIQVVTEDAHDANQISRKMAIAAKVPEPARIRVLETQADMMRKQIAMLEAYIISRYKPESYYTFESKKDLGAQLIEMATKQSMSHRVYDPSIQPKPMSNTP